MEDFQKDQTAGPLRQKSGAWLTRLHAIGLRVVQTARVWLPANMARCVEWFTGSGVATGRRTNNRGSRSGDRVAAEAIETGGHEGRGDRGMPLAGRARCQCRCVGWVMLQFVRRSLLHMPPGGRQPCTSVASIGPGERLVRVPDCRRLDPVELDLRAQNGADGSDLPGPAPCHLARAARGAS